MQRLPRGPHASSARAQTYELVRDEIVAVRFKPRERISDVAIAAELGVSRTPVREALLQLADEGLVDVVPQSGTFVAPISIAGVKEAQFIREALEIASLGEAVERIGETELRALERNLEHQREAGRDGDTDRFYALDQAFHRLLMEAGGHPQAYRITERSRAQLNRVRILSLPGREVIESLAAQHAEILARVIARDEPGAKAALRDHLRVVYQHLPELERQHPDYFEATVADERRNEVELRGAR
jgi:DNA-binding GntR family transcriptional regulator